MFLGGRRADARAFSRGACDNTRSVPGDGTCRHAPDSGTSGSRSVDRYRRQACRPRQVLPGASSPRRASLLPLARCRHTFRAMHGRSEDDTAEGHNDSGWRSRIRVRGERRLCANAGDNNQRNTDIRGSGQSAAAMAQEASNPFASSWALQLQQNNNWTEMPRGDDRVQSNLLFQPLLSLRLTEKQGLIIRPMVPIVNSIPHLDQRGQNERTDRVRRHRSRICAAAFPARRPAHGRRRPDVHLPYGIEGSAQPAHMAGGA